MQPSVRIVDRTEIVSRRRPSGGVPFCVFKGCSEFTAEGKPFCKDHVLAHPYALIVRREVDRLARRGLVDDPPEPLLPPSIVSARLFRSRVAAARAGHHQGRAPFGYTRDEQLRLVPAMPAADVVRMIFAEYLRLQSVDRLAEVMNERELVSPRGRPWSRQSLTWILRNDTYAGRVHFGSVRAKAKHEPLVSIETMRSVARVLASKRRSSA